MSDDRYVINYKQLARTGVGRCHHEVTRAGILEPCDKTGVALAWLWDDWDGAYVAAPVCVHHLRIANAVPLTDYFTPRRSEVAR
ncbi:hypothetical protein SEA_HORUS_87 [Gordonia phage Horus]|uniref:Uncharacterized protein n=1 Tax=Gordonia phage Horus TaxID=2301696 RepID=A0A385DZM3_9CAUD|nr:hypothetical protein HOT93_gp063 [Gordonia phage Horus]AXQ63939.1 hypothetical protein SEA_HORUS_87 [Gordonia phage Horus]